MKSYALISGATGGLGKAFAVECAARGWNLFITDLKVPALAALAEGLSRSYGVEVLYEPCDLTEPSCRARLWDHIRERDLHFHWLINVAGVDFEGPFRERSIDELSTIIRVNIEATVEFTRRVLPCRNPGRTLRIINVCSLAGYYPMPTKAMYAASKRFLLDFSLALRYELRGSNVSVTALCPAGMPTTPSAIAGIETQGFMGRITTKNVGTVAAKTVDHALAGRVIYIPGTVNLVLRVLGGIVPPTWVAGLIGRRWIKTRSMLKEC